MRNVGFGLLFGLFGGLSSEGINIEMHLHPNQGIHNSGWTALRVGSVVGVFFGLLAGLLLGPLFGLVGGVGIGFLSGLLLGGGDYLKHYILRNILCLNGSLPWHTVRFLEEATERILLQRIGGGYRFIHPLFQEYFASQGSETSPSAQSQSSPPQP